jgi:hypothetical protein
LNVILKREIENQKKRVHEHYKREIENRKKQAPVQKEAKKRQKKKRAKRLKEQKINIKKILPCQIKTLQNLCKTEKIVVSEKMKKDYIENIKKEQKKQRKLPKLKGKGFFPLKPI